jgi:hypothetical protein
MSTTGQFCRFGSHLRAGTVLLILLALVSSGPAPGSGSEEELDWGFKEALLAPVKEWGNELRKEKNASGVSFKKLSYSRNPRKIDDTRYQLTAHLNTAEESRQVTERYLLTLEQPSGKGGWEIAEKEVIDTYVGLYRTTGAACFPFESFSFDREGLKLSASNGSLCAEFMEGGIPSFGLHSDDLRHAYEPPPHVQLVPTGHDFYAMHKLLSVDHSGQLEYDAAAFFFRCDVETCEQLLNDCFTGLTLPTVEERGNFKYDESAVDEWAKRIIKETIKDRKEDAFEDFRVLDRPGHVWYSAFLPRELHDADDGIWLAFDNWGGWEVAFGVTPKRWDTPNQLAGPVYGYYSEETAKNTTPYDLERRENNQTRWFEVYSLKGEVDLATELPEELHGDVEFGLTLKQDVKDLPFFIISFRDRGITDSSRPKPIVVNSVQVDGEEVTWVQTGEVSGRVILPEVMPAGSKIKLRMDWTSRAILSYTHSYSYLPRQGWIPFVRYGDTIAELELTLRAPAKYDIIGIGHKVDERVEGGIRISHWKADSPVNFPTVIFGRYRSDKPKFDAKKLDGTVIPITVHVDEASFMDWGIRPTALRPIAEQAANAINLYAAVSGLDYPFGELNLVNDPRGFLYGQAPSSLIYLGSGVFRGEGALAPYFLDATSIAKFLKSVVAHEVGHQWWSSTIASANTRNYWFVESLAEYFSAVYLEAVYGPNEYSQQVDEWRRNIFESNLKGSVQNASSLFSGEWGGGRETGSYTAAVYNKGPYAFHMLRETFRGPGPRGPEGADQRFFAFLKQFSQELAETREIVTLDIQRAAEKGLGGVDENGRPFNVDLGWFFDQWIRGSGMPQYSFDYDVRETEDGQWIIEGDIRQRVYVGKSDQVIEGRVYRGVVDVTVKGKGGPYVKRLVINEETTPVLLKVPVKPFEVALNENGEMLAHDTLYNRD